jgi:hypothetical protein
MRESFAHEAVLSMDHDADVRAPGAAITVALCGHWDHEPPCPLAPHHTAAIRAGDEVRLRVLFAVEAELEPEVRHAVDAALAGGELIGPDGIATCWRLQGSGPSVVLEREAAHAGRLVNS